MKRQSTEMAGQDRSNQYLRYTRTNSGDGLLTSSYAIDYVYRGKSFCVVDWFEIAAGGTQYFVFDTSSAGFLSVAPPLFTSTGGPVFVTIYSGTDYTGVDSLNVQNRNARSTIANVATIKDQATGTTKGDVLVRYLIPSSKKESGSIADALPFVFNGHKYLIEVENEDSSAVYFGFDFIWYED